MFLTSLGSRRRRRGAATPYFLWRLASTPRGEWRVPRRNTGDGATLGGWYSTGRACQTVVGRYSPRIPFSPSRAFPPGRCPGTRNGRGIGVVSGTLNWNSLGFESRDARVCANNSDIGAGTRYALASPAQLERSRLERPSQTVAGSVNRVRGCRRLELPGRGRRVETFREGPASGRRGTLPQPNERRPENRGRQLAWRPPAGRAKGGLARPGEGQEATHATRYATLTHATGTGTDIRTRRGGAGPAGREKGAGGAAARTAGGRFVAAFARRMWGRAISAAVAADPAHHHTLPLLVSRERWFCSAVRDGDQLTVSIGPQCE